jgi:hypothetical protein
MDRSEKSATVAQRTPIQSNAHSCSARIDEVEYFERAVSRVFDLSVLACVSSVRNLSLLAHIRGRSIRKIVSAALHRVSIAYIKTHLPNSTHVVLRPLGSSHQQYKPPVPNPRLSDMSEQAPTDTSVDKMTGISPRTSQAITDAPKETLEKLIRYVGAVAPNGRGMIQWFFLKKPEQCGRCDRMYLPGSEEGGDSSCLYHNG